MTRTSTRSGSEVDENAIVPTGEYSSPAMTALPVPHAIQVPDRAPKERYVDPEFFRLEAEQLWSRVWQMACRLEEIPEPGDFVEYEILDQSVLVVRTDQGDVRAF